MRLLCKTSVPIKQHVLLTIRLNIKDASEFFWKLDKVG